jgi:molybdopterin converting factor subunit 1
VLFFAGLRDVLNQEEVGLSLSPGATLASLTEELFPDLGERKRRLKSVLFAINHDLASLDTPLKDGDEVALLPPMSGG